MIGGLRGVFFANFGGAGYEGIPMTVWTSKTDTFTPLLGYEGPFAEFVGANPIYDARAFLFGGGEIGPHTLLRFYILHCIFIPLVASILMAVHFWRIRRDGFSGPSL